MSLTYDQAIKELTRNAAAYTTPEELSTLVNKVSADATGKVTMLYSGGQPNGISNPEILKGMLNNGDDIRVISNSSAAKFLESRELQAAAARVHGVMPSEITQRGTAINQWFDAPKTGQWADVSRRFVDATKGDIRTLTGNADPQRIFMQDELPRILNNKNITSVDGIEHKELVKMGQDKAFNTITKQSSADTKQLKIATDPAGKSIISKGAAVVDSSHYFDKTTGITGKKPIIPSLASKMMVLGQLASAALDVSGGGKSKNAAGCIGKIVAGVAITVGAELSADMLMRAIKTGVIEAQKEPPPPAQGPKAVTITHQIKHASLMAALAGAVVGALVATAAAAVAVAIVGATGGLAVAAVGVAGMTLAGPLIGMAVSATTNFIDGLLPADDGPVIKGSKNVLIEGLMAARATLDQVACTKHGPTPIPIAQGSGSVYINNMPAVRVDDKTACGAPIKQGAKRVFIGGKQTTAMAIADEFSFWEKALIMGVEFLVPPSKGIFTAISKIPSLLTKAAPKLLKGISKGASIATSRSVGKITKDALIKGKAALKTALVGLCNLKSKSPDKSSSTNNTENSKTAITCTLGNPVDPITGDVVKNYVDFSLGQTIPLVFQRVYRSANKSHGLLGQGWWDSFGEHLEIDATKKQVTLHASDGLIVTFDVPINAQRIFNRRYPHLLLMQSPEGYAIKNSDTQLLHYYQYIGDNKARLSKVADFQGNAIHYKQNALGKPIQISHTDGIVLQLAYENDYLTQIIRTDGGKKDVIAKYQQQNEQLVHAWSKGETNQQISYTPQGLMASITYHQHSNVSYQYDEQERCISIRGSEGFHHWDLSYDQQQKINTARDAANNLWQFHYNNDQQVIKEITPNNDEYHFDYDRYGLLISQTNPLKQSIHYQHDPWTGKLISITDSIGRSTELTYDEDFEDILTIKDASGTTHFDYNAEHQLTQVIHPDGSTDSYQHDQAGNLIETIKNGRFKRHFNYDKANHLVSATDWLEHEQRFEYTHHDQLKKVMTARGNTWRYHYDQHHRLSEIHSPVQDGLKSQEQIEYTSAHQPHCFVDDNQHKQRTDYSVFNLATKQTDAEGNITHFEYDKIHQYIRNITNPKGDCWSFTYDKVGNLATETDYNGQVTHYTYDAIGNLATKKTAIGDTLRYYYDDANRLTQKHTPDGTTLYSWDEQDRLLQLETPHSTIHYEYDKKGRLCKEEQNGQCIAYEYNEHGQRSARHIHTSPWYAEGKTQTTDYEYDANGQLIQLTLPEQQPLSLRYDEEGHLIHQESADGYINHQSIDAKGRIQQQYIGKDAPEKYQHQIEKQGEKPQYTQIERTYEYDAADNLLQCRSVSGNTQWHYNKNNQVTHHQQRHEKHQFTYNSQLGVQQHNEQDYHYSPAGQLVSKQQNQTATHHYHYDNNGRLIEKISERNGFRKTTQQYEWSSENQLIKVITEKGHHWHYHYDGFGRRILKHNSNTNETTHILWDGNTVAQEIQIIPKNAGNKEQEEQTVKTTHWYFIPNSFYPLAQQTQSNQTTNALYTCYITTDHMGTVKELFNPQGDLVWKNNNSLWGKPNRQIENNDHTTTIDCSLGFQGQYLDQETRLHYNYHRYYDADMGQYISPDPIGLLGGLHPQAYVHNPNGWVDPLGLAKCKPSALNKLLSKFKSSRFHINGVNILLDKKGMKHILERHHPRYWNGTIKATQSFFPKKMTVGEINSAISEVLNQNRLRVAQIGSNSMGSMTGIVNGVTYQLGLNKGRVGQFFSINKD